ncbi:DUF6886 family protein [Paenibacillus spongiae]|uniref:DUF4433 domain-containing protein n=1 Tax=Paenibacillus spongiae TaxID=2909671 RepID=A0ABY5SFK4_9BACL|nr:DUF6886 family protein [Paenibacillus spongiae]UVI32756.1 hypothetical protein L1F29_13405 [Paenibacillus spongiae]
MNLYHFSEEPDIAVFKPRKLEYRSDEPAMVWAIDEFHAPHYYFPRECPRVCIWPKEDTTDADLQRFFGQSGTTRIVAIETAWYERMKKAVIYRYRFNTDSFSCHTPDAGYYISLNTVEPYSVDRLDSLPEQIIALGIELRITPSLRPLQAVIPSSTVNFSMIRMKNATP